MENGKEIYNATIKVVDNEVLQNLAEEYYGGDIESAIVGELSWVHSSGLEVELEV